MSWHFVPLGFGFRSMPSGKAKHNARFVPGGDSFFKCRIRPKADFFAFYPDASIPAFVPSIPANARDAGRIVGLLPAIPMVFRMAAVAQIFDAVIRCVAVEMVNILLRPFSVMNNPSDTVCFELFPQNVSDLIAARCRSQRFSPGMFCIPRSTCPIVWEHLYRSGQPVKFPSLRLIAQQLTKRFRGRYFSDSHCAVPSREGQGRALFPQRFRPAFSSKNHQILQASAKL